jgi:hypothetical protein
MKKSHITLFILFVLSLTINAQKPIYDSILAKNLQADNYGMKMYVFVMLKTGTNTSTDKTARDKAFAGHMKNIQYMADNGKLAVAGPFEKGGTHRGLFILKRHNF